MPDLPKNTPVKVKGASKISATVAFENLAAPRALAPPADSSLLYKKTLLTESDRISEAFLILDS